MTRFGYGMMAILALAVAANTAFLFRQSAQLTMLADKIGAMTRTLASPSSIPRHHDPVAGERLPPRSDARDAVQPLDPVTEADWAALVARIDALERQIDREGRESDAQGSTFAEKRHQNTQTALSVPPASRYARLNALMDQQPQDPALQSHVAASIEATLAAHNEYAALTIESVDCRLRACLALIELNETVDEFALEFRLTDRLGDIFNGFSPYLLEGLTPGSRRLALYMQRPAQKTE